MYVFALQDDSSLNVKVVARLIESEKTGPFANATLLTADDGATAVEQLRTEMASGRAVHFILMDSVMVSFHSVFSFSPLKFPDIS
jgi:CheY-like chemotaxis protein